VKNIKAPLPKSFSTNLLTKKSKNLDN